MGMHNKIYTQYWLIWNKQKKNLILGVQIPNLKSEQQ